MASALDYFRRCVALCEAQIRIAGPNRCMIGHCLWYANQLDTAIAEAHSVCEDAQRFGVVPVRVFAQATLTQVLTEAGRFEEAIASGEKALVLARLAGSRRYEATVLYFCAEHKLRQGDRARARNDMEQALALARQTGLGFIGAALQGRLARLADSAEERAAHLAEGEALLKDTGLAHNYLWFCRDAMEASLAARDWSCALHHAASLERRFHVETLPWVGLMVERARAIAAAAQTSKDAAAMTRLREVRATAVAAGNGWALAGIDQALT
jgi:tetratricopeptide (TPR) repeat protein